MPKYDFQYEFSMSRIIQTFLKNSLMTNNSLGAYLFLKIIFCKLQFLTHFVFKNDAKFLTNCHSLYSQNKMISSQYVDFWPKMFLFRIHHLSNLTRILFQKNFQPIVLLPHRKLKILHNGRVII